jgi:hypothetical protein
MPCSLENVDRGRRLRGVAPNPHPLFQVFSFRFSVEIVKMAFTENRKQETENSQKVGRGV